MSFTTIEYTINQRIAYITLNRPEKRNAFSPELVTDLKKAFDKAAHDPDVKVIVLHAKGKVFSAGADLSALQQLQNNTYEDNLRDSGELAALFQMIYTLPKVVIAQVEGPAIAGGCGLATICDLVFATPQASFGYTEVKIGFLPAIVMIFLLRKIGETRSKELLLSGELITADTALKMGLINFISDAETISETVFNYAQKLCNEASADSLRLTKQMIAHVQGLSLQDALQYAAGMNASARATDDCKRGIAAFLNKEKITW
ncbi:methylglutaconyl-CoA hydratase [Sphingobacteriales bacterium UPWRP_1]|nr:methylglutaconyl-CoA hydratase [Sphingobacteriales bacterium TSM_CSM]PSJ76274.1 methylglutaconyl-CoA hydratase [Sphingobacteriales bacterium UPWRP_1]